MICKRCNKNTATTHVVRTVNGVSREYYLCKICANSLSFSPDIMSFLPGDLFKTIAKDIGVRADLAQKKCEFCKSAFDEIAAKGVAGCARCYLTFSEQFAPYLNRLHSKISHIGKLPKLAGAKISQKRTIDELKSQLQSAIERQNFEQAAVLRDKIRELQSSESEGSV